jgi:hypothetical protein
VRAAWLSVVVVLVCAIVDAPPRCGGVGADELLVVAPAAAGVAGEVALRAAGTAPGPLTSALTR